VGTVGKIVTVSWKVTVGTLEVTAEIKNVLFPEQKLQRKGTVLTTQGWHWVFGFPPWLEQEEGLLTLG
jgi:hypothetical protein